MNKKRTEFLNRNQDPLIELYLFKNDWKIREFIYYPYSYPDKKGIKSGFIITGYTDDLWTEEKIFLSSLEDVQFFVDWYCEANNLEAKLIKS